MPEITLTPEEYLKLFKARFKANLVTSILAVVIAVVFIVLKFNDTAAILLFFTSFMFLQVAYYSHQVRRFEKRVASLPLEVPEVVDAKTITQAEKAVSEMKSEKVVTPDTSIAEESVPKPAQEEEPATTAEAAKPVVKKPAAPRKPATPRKPTATKKPAVPRKTAVAKKPVEKEPEA